MLYMHGSFLSCNVTQLLNVNSCILIYILFNNYPQKIDKPKNSLKNGTAFGFGLTT